MCPLLLHSDSTVTLHRLDEPPLSPPAGDLGTSNARFGFAGEDTPKSFLPSQVGHRKGRDDDGTGEAWAISDAELSCRRDGLAIRSAVVGGLSADWEVIEKLWTRAFEWLNITNEHCVLCAEAPWSTSSHREQLMELMFEK